MNKTILLFGLILFAGTFGMQSCIIEGCTDEDAANYDSSATDDDGSCEYIYGCTDSDAYNYAPNAGIDDGSCAYYGEAVFWTDANYGVGNISVYVGGSYVGQISSYYSSGTPDCGASGCVTITRVPGIYTFTASATGANWNSTNIIIYENDCSTMRLYVTKDGEIKVSQETHVQGEQAVMEDIAD
jgi:hypothetical protein